ncbi:MAG: hypothetical protein HC871_09950 [Rhizobiales bacterium]|nr:hypothetical protein [Hyphomicrobiales bacterium]
MSEASVDARQRQGFEQPDDVLERSDLTYEQKLDILQRWHADLQKASGERAGLRRVEQAIERLQVEVTFDPDKPESAPSGKGYRPAS